MDFVFIIKYTLIIALLSLDMYNIFLAGFSRSLITGAIIGFLLNNLYMGILIGVIIELMMINLIPIGSFIPPNGAVVTGITLILAYYFHIHKTGVLLPIILIYSIFWGHLVKRFVRVIWKKNSYSVERFLQGVQNGKINFIFYNFGNLFIDFILFFILIFLGNYFGILIFKKIISIFSVSFHIHFTLKYALLFLPLFAFTFLLNSFDVKSKILYIISGFIITFLFSAVFTQTLVLFFILGGMSYLVLILLYRLRVYRYDI